MTLAVRPLDKTGIGLTVNTTAFEVTVPTLLLHTAWYCLLLSAAVAANVNVAFVAPLTFVHVVPFVDDCHCTVGDGIPLADEVKLTFCPTHFVCEAGCMVIVGASVTAWGFTVTTRF